MRIDVLQKHINTAFKRNSHHCAIADAITDQVLGAKFILVDLQSIRWTDMELKERYIYLTPPVAQNLILKFDRGAKCEPISFQLKNPRIQPVYKDRNLNPDRHHERKYPGGHHRESKIAYKDREFGIRQFKK